MLLQLPPAPADPWPASAIHDTVAAIVRHRAYHRSLRTSLFERLWTAFWDWVERFFTAVRSTPHAREWTIFLVIAVAALVVARVLYVAKFRGDDVADHATGGTRRRGVDHWALATRAAAEGRYTDAAHALYRALLQRLAARERLRLHPSKTAGDYARELRAVGASSYPAFRDFGRRYDRIIYGEGTCDAAGYDALLRAATPLLDLERAA